MGDLGRADTSGADFSGADALRAHHPGLSALLDRTESVHGIVFEELAAARTSASPRSSASLADLVARLTGVIESEASEPPTDPFAVLGPRAAEVVQWSHRFQREVLSILADPDVTDRPAALTEAVRVYRSRPDIALPTAPKNMDVVYGHAHALAFRNEYGPLDGLTWAAHWLRLAATEPLTDLAAGPERAAGMDTVMHRYLAKLSGGAPPDSLPSEIPLAPAIAPGLIWLSPEAAIVWDNTSLLLEVLGDVLASADSADIAPAIQATLDFFLDPEVAVTHQDDWEIMALRHGIFFQGGFPLAVMTQNERNVGGHAAHLMGGGILRSIPGMPR